MNVGSASPLLERLDAFFGEGANTDAVGDFMAAEQEALLSVTGETVAPDSREGLVAYALFKRYSVMMEDMLEKFIVKEAASESPISLEQLAEAVMDELKQPYGSFRLLCTPYIAAALDFDAFVQLALETTDIGCYDGEEYSEEEEEDEEDGETQ